MECYNAVKMRPRGLQFQSRNNIEGMCTGTVEMLELMEFRPGALEKDPWLHKGQTSRISANFFICIYTTMHARVSD